MATEVTGTVHGSTITLDAPVPPLDGRRVRVVWKRPTPRISFCQNKSKITCGANGSTMGRKGHSTAKRRGLTRHDSTG
jgi:hypothetical protein